MILPPGLAAAWPSGAEPAGWAPWLDRLASLTAAVVADWSLRVDGAPAHGAAALVVPVRTEDGEPAMLKLGFPDEESEHEHLALRRWDGQGAVRLIRADPGRRALLLERLTPIDDPKPINGDPHYEPEPMLRNRFEEYGAVGSVREGIRRRFHILVDTADLDEDRARAWVVVRSVLNAHGAFRAQRGRTSAAEREHITRCITIAKAVQD